MDYEGGSLSCFLINVFLSKSRTGGLKDDSRVETVLGLAEDPGTSSSPGTVSLQVSGDLTPSSAL